ncbi:MAG: helix-turn-helix transcriptional regulator, partial [Gemmatimonadota bacterium]
AADFYLPRLRVGDGSESSPRRRPATQRFEVAAEDLGLTLGALRAALTIPDSPFAADTRSALRKLSFDLDTLDDRPPLLRAGGPARPDLASSLTLLSEALLRRKRVTFSYRSPVREHATQRDVAPYGVMFEMGSWYCVGHDALRDDIRVFRVDRMRKPVANHKRPGTADYDIPEGFSLEALRDRRAWQYGDEDESWTVRVQFSQPLSMWAERNDLGRAEESASGSTVRSFDVQRVEPFVDWILSLDGGAEILGPPEVAACLRGRAEIIRTLHAGEAGDGR